MAKISKSAQIPKLGTAARKILLENITDFPIYMEYLDKGRRFFTKDQLTGIQNDCKDGVTWEDIDKIISQQGLVLTQSTFRKYLQDGLLPRATGHKSTAKGSSAIYESDIIRHLNLLLFIFNVPSNDFLNMIINHLIANEISAAGAVETQLDRPLYAAICVDLYQSSRDVLDAIDTTLAKHPKKVAEARELFAELETIFQEQLEPKIQALVKLLEDYNMQLSDIPQEN